MADDITPIETITDNRSQPIFLVGGENGQITAYYDNGAKDAGGRSLAGNRVPMGIPVAIVTDDGRGNITTEIFEAGTDGQLSSQPISRDVQQAPPAAQEPAAPAPQQPAGASPQEPVAQQPAQLPQAPMPRALPDQPAQLPQAPMPRAAGEPSLDDMVRRMREGGNENLVVTSVDENGNYKVKSNDGKFTGTINTSVALLSEPPRYPISWDQPEATRTGGMPNSINQNSADRLAQKPGVERAPRRVIPDPDPGMVIPSRPGNIDRFMIDPDPGFSPRGRGGRSGEPVPDDIIRRLRLGGNDNIVVTQGDDGNYNIKSKDGKFTGTINTSVALLSEPPRYPISWDQPEATRSGMPRSISQPEADRLAGVERREPEWRVERGPARVLPEGTDLPGAIAGRRNPDIRTMEWIESRDGGRNSGIRTMEWVESRDGRNGGVVQTMEARMNANSALLSEMVLTSNGADRVGSITGANAANRDAATQVVATASDRYEGSRPVQYAMSSPTTVEAPQTPTGPSGGKSVV